MTFQISDKVCCVNDTPPECGWEPLIPVVKGTVYVIRDAWDDADAGELIQLTGMPEATEWAGRVGYDPKRFRKIEETQAEARAKGYYGASYKGVQP